MNDFKNHFVEGSPSIAFFPLFPFFSFFYCFFWVSLACCIRICLSGEWDFLSEVGPPWFPKGWFCIQCPFCFSFCATCSEEMFEFKWRTTCFDSLRAKLIWTLTCQCEVVNLQWVGVVISWWDSQKHAHLNIFGQIGLIGVKSPPAGADRDLGSGSSRENFKERGNAHQTIMYKAFTKYTATFEWMNPRMCVYILNLNMLYIP